MKTAADILNELRINNQDGFYTYEPNGLTEIHINEVDCSIRVWTFRTDNHMMDAVKKESFLNLNGMMGKKSIDEQFGEIMSKF